MVGIMGSLVAALFATGITAAVKLGRVLDVMTEALQ